MRLRDTRIYEYIEKYPQKRFEKSQWFEKVLIANKIETATDRFNRFFERFFLRWNGKSFFH